MLRQKTILFLKLFNLILVLKLFCQSEIEAFQRRGTHGRGNPLAEAAALGAIFNRGHNIVVGSKGIEQLRIHA